MPKEKEKRKKKAYLRPDKYQKQSPFGKSKGLIHQLEKASTGS